MRDEQEQHITEEVTENIKSEADCRLFCTGENVGKICDEADQQEISILRDVFSAVAAGTCTDIFMFLGCMY
jgi:hypothetical protein